MHAAWVLMGIPNGFGALWCSRGGFLQLYTKKPAESAQRRSAPPGELTQPAPGFRDLWSQFRIAVPPELDELAVGLDCLLQVSPFLVQLAQPPVGAGQLGGIRGGSHPVGAVDIA